MLQLEMGEYGYNKARRVLQGRRRPVGAGPAVSSWPVEISPFEIICPANQGPTHRQNRPTIGIPKLAGSAIG